MLSLLLLALGVAGAAGVGTPTCGAPRSPGALCCFRDADVRVHRARGSGSEVLVVDNFLCRDALSSLLDLAASSYDKGDWDGGSDWDGIKGSDEVAFPGNWLGLGGRRRDSQTAARFVEGGYLDCVAEAARVAGLSTDAPPFDALARSDSGGGGGNGGGAAWRSDEARLANLFRKPSRNFVHVDWGSLVTNVHLSSRHNGTGTQFWSSEGAPRAYGVGSVAGGGAGRGGGHGNESDEEERQLGEALVALEAFPDPFSLDDAILVATGGPGNRPADYAGRTDPTGVFQHLESVPYRLNRLLAYSGHLFHSALVEGDSYATMDEDPRAGRVVLQEFRTSPGLAGVAERYEAFEQKGSTKAMMRARWKEAWKKYQQLGGARPAPGANEEDAEHAGEEEEDEYLD